VNGDWPLATKLPLVGGHEGAGVVVALGSLVEDIALGDYAGVKVYHPLSLRRSPREANTRCSGSMAPAYNALSANKQTNPSVPKHSFLATQLTGPSKNTVSPRLHMSHAFPRNVT
jgi:hypothetical protein